MPYYLYAWIASLTYGFHVIIAKLTGKYQLTNTYQFAFFNLFFGGITMSIIALLKGAQIPHAWGFVLLAGLFFGLSSSLYLFALKNLDITVISPLYNIRTVITIILGILFLGESLTGMRLIYVLVIVIAGFFATMDERFSVNAFFHRSVLFGLLYMCILAVQSIFINRAIDQTDYWTATLWVGILSTVFAFPLLYPRFAADLRKTPVKHYQGVLLLALVGGVGDIAAFKAFEGNVGISSVIISLPLSMALTVIFSLYRPHLLEKHTPAVYAVRFTAAGIMIYSALQLSGNL